MDTVYCANCGQLNLTSQTNCLYCETCLPVLPPPGERNQPAQPRAYFANDPDGASFPDPNAPQPTLQYAPTQQKPPLASPWNYPGAQSEPGYYAPQQQNTYSIPSAQPPGYQGVDAFGLPSYSAYAPPQMPNQLEKAERGARFVAAFLDGLIALPFVGVGLALWITFFSPFDGSRKPDADLMSYVFIFGCMIPYWLIQGYLLTVSGQSLGKKAMGIRIVKESSGQNEGFMPNVFLRWIVPTLINMACGVFSLVDVLFIFGDENKCLHDMMAGTIVVKNGHDYLKLN